MKTTKKSGIIHSETGSAQFIEMTIIFPIVICIALLCFITGVRHYQICATEAYAKRYAVLLSKEADTAGYIDLLENYLNEEKAEKDNAGSVNLINALCKSKKKDLYGKNEEISTFKEKINAYLQNGEFAFSDCSGTVKYNKKHITPTVDIEIVCGFRRTFKNILGFSDRSFLSKVYASSGISDDAERIRNIELICDVAEEVKNYAGQSEYYDLLKSKISKAFG